MQGEVNRGTEGVLRKSQQRFATGCLDSDHRRFLNRVLCRSQRDQGYTDDDEHSRPAQFPVCDQISKSLERHHGSVGKARPCREGD
jgi:hypothetical protein